MVQAPTRSTCVLQVRQAVRDGYDVRGYFYWTLIECAKVMVLLAVVSALFACAMHRIECSLGA